ncbi:MAG: hypothetical protein KDF58_02180 [Alphaproteobacteria bacterium]|nr:hypothetical protein [Alphaproteobacteria bacterium]HPF46737.1 hypothetical protein [Emcibacteraceae bacterium]HRW31030.1 hypothetical protein [Emcibacteraceae bacterium]
MDENEFIIEFIAMGNSVKVTCIDLKSGREVSTIGPANLSKDQLSKAAINKMHYVLKKEQS